MQISLNATILVLFGDFIFLLLFVSNKLVAVSHATNNPDLVERLYLA